MTRETNLNDYVLAKNTSRLFVQAFRDFLGQSDDIDRWASEGRVFFYHLFGRTPLDILRSGAFDGGNSTNKIALAYTLDPPPGASIKWMKPATDVVVHEFGHVLRLCHAPLRLLGTQAAGGVFSTHLSHDHCVMNYDPDTQSFCAGCILTTWGWSQWRALKPRHGDASSRTWRRKCHERLKLLSESSDHPAPALRLALFEAKVREDVAAADRAVALAVERTATDGGAQHVWLLRSLIVYYDDIGDRERAQEAADELCRLTQSPADLDDLVNPDRTAVEVHYSVEAAWDLS
jgi:hypothetical protein